MVDRAAAGKRKLQFIYTREPQGNLGTRHHECRRPRPPDIADTFTTGHRPISALGKSEQCVSRVSVGSIAHPGVACASAMDRNTAVPGTRAWRHLVRFTAGESHEAVVARTDGTSGVHLAEGTRAGYWYRHVL